MDEDFVNRFFFDLIIILTLGQSLLVCTLVRPLLPPPGQSCMDKTYMTLNKNIPFTLGSNSKTKLNFFGTLKI